MNESYLIVKYGSISKAIRVWWLASDAMPKEEYEYIELNFARLRSIGIEAETL